MKLRGNAALSLNKRKLLVHRVMEEDWSLSEAARAAEVSERSGAGSAGSPASNSPSPPTATSAEGPARSCTSTSKSSGASSAAPDTGSPAADEATRPRRRSTGIPIHHLRQSANRSPDTLAASGRTAVSGV
jgi:hypothetical protein